MTRIGRFAARSLLVTTTTLSAGLLASEAAFSAVTVTTASIANGRLTVVFQRELSQLGA